MLHTNKRYSEQLPSGNSDEMKTMSSCMNKLDNLGYTTQFKAEGSLLESLATQQKYRPEQVQIVNFYRFEGPSNPEDNAILYAIITESGEKGTITDAYGAYNDHEITLFIREVEQIGKKVDTDTPMG